MTVPVLHLRGRILVSEHEERAEAWVLGGRLTFERPASEPDAVIEGWILPGLVDMHCHIGVTTGGPADQTVAEKNALADRDAGTLLMRDAGSPIDTSWVHGRDDLPRLIRAGRFIARPKRYIRGLARALDDAAELPMAAAAEARAGDGWVKLIADWIDRDRGAEADLEPLWPSGVLAAGVAAAHAEGARVTAHTFAEESVTPLLDAGIDCLEHGTGMTAAHMERAAAAGVPVVPTLLQVGQFDAIAAQGEVKFPRFAARMHAMYARRFEQVRAMRDAGVRLLVGTDAGGTIGHGEIAREAAEMVAAGLPATEVVAAATWWARDYLGARGLDEGASADLVAFPTDPRQDIRVLAAPTAVVLRGVAHPSRG